MLILASASKSRKELLENSKIKFIQVSSDFDETSLKINDVNELAKELAFCKAKSVLNKLMSLDLLKENDSNRIQILGCDSIFDFKSKAYGKPKNKKEAFERLSMMSSNFGFLKTGHCILFCEFNKKNSQLFIKRIVKQTVSSKVYFVELKEKEIINYVDSLEPLYCAGGFALEGIGGKYIKKIEGCFSNVMGLSLPWLRDTLLGENINI